MFMLYVAALVAKGVTVAPTPTPTVAPTPPPEGTLRYFAGKRTWPDAEQKCIAEGGHLVSVLNADQEKELQDFVKKQGKADTFWIGANDRDSEVSASLEAILNFEKSYTVVANR